MDNYLNEFECIWIYIFGFGVKLDFLIFSIV